MMTTTTGEEVLEEMMTTTTGEEVITMKENKTRTAGQGRRIVIGRIETREEMKTATAGTGVVNRKENKTRTVGEDKTEEWELKNSAEVQVMEVAGVVACNTEL
jgi:hypothetical protein